MPGYTGLQEGHWDLDSDVTSYVDDRCPTTWNEPKTTTYEDEGGWSPIAEESELRDGTPRYPGRVKPIDGNLLRRLFEATIQEKRQAEAEAAARNGKSREKKVAEKENKHGPRERKVADRGFYLPSKLSPGLDSQRKTRYEEPVPGLTVTKESADIVAPSVPVKAAAEKLEGRKETLKPSKPQKQTKKQKKKAVQAGLDEEDNDKVRALATSLLAAAPPPTGPGSIASAELTQTLEHNLGGEFKGSGEGAWSGARSSKKSQTSKRSQALLEKATLARRPSFDSFEEVGAGWVTEPVVKEDLRQPTPAFSSGKSSALGLEPVDGGWNANDVVERTSRRSTPGHHRSATSMHSVDSLKEDWAELRPTPEECDSRATSASYLSGQAQSSHDEAENKVLSHHSSLNKRSARQTSQTTRSISPTVSNGDGWHEGGVDKVVSRAKTASRYSQAASHQNFEETGDNSKVITSNPGSPAFAIGKNPSRASGAARSRRSLSPGWGNAGPVKLSSAETAKKAGSWNRVDEAPPGTPRYSSNAPSVHDWVNQQTQRLNNGSHHAELSIRSSHDGRPPLWRSSRSRSQSMAHTQSAMYTDSRCKTTRREDSKSSARTNRNSRRTRSVMNQRSEPSEFASDEEIAVDGYETEWDNRNPSRASPPHNDRHQNPPTVFAGKGWISPHPISRSPTDIASPPQSKIMLPSETFPRGATLTYEQWKQMQEQGLRMHHDRRNFSRTDSDNTRRSRLASGRYKFVGWGAQSSDGYRFEEIETERAGTTSVASNYRSPTVQSEHSSDRFSDERASSSHQSASARSQQLSASVHEDPPVTVHSERKSQQLSATQSRISSTYEEHHLREARPHIANSESRSQHTRVIQSQKSSTYEEQDPPSKHSSKASFSPKRSEHELARSQSSHPSSQYSSRHSRIKSLSEASHLHHTPKRPSSQRHSQPSRNNLPSEPSSHRSYPFPTANRNPNHTPTQASRSPHPPSTRSHATTTKSSSRLALEVMEEGLNVWSAIPSYDGSTPSERRRRQRSIERLGAGSNAYRPSNASTAGPLSDASRESRTPTSQLYWTRYRERSESVSAVVEGGGESESEEEGDGEGEWEERRW